MAARAAGLEHRWFPIADVSIPRDVQAFRQLIERMAVEDALAAAVGSQPSAEAVERLGAGLVAEEALAIALYCALAAPDFRSGVLLAVNHSGDSDSTGAIAGNLLGAELGLSALPEPGLEELELCSVITTVARDLWAAGEGAALSFERYPGS